MRYVDESSITLLDLNGFVYRKLIRFVSGTDPFASALSRFNSLPEESVASVLQKIPEDWGCTEQEKYTLLTYLMTRHAMIPSVPELLRHRLPYWKGGV